MENKWLLAGEITDKWVEDLLAGRKYEN